MTKPLLPVAGSRQPVLKLKSVMPNGRRIQSHPLLWAMDERLPYGWDKTDVANRLGVRPQSLYKWLRFCRLDRNFPLPIIRAGQLAEIFNVPPSLFRPDIPWSK